MYKHNFVKVGMVVSKIKLGDAYSNALEIVKIIEKDEFNAILVFPEDSNKGYFDIMTSFFPGFVMLSEQYYKIHNLF